MLRVKSPQDLGAGLVFTAIGLAGVYFARHLALGSTLRIGPGYFPTLLSCLIVGIGVILMMRALVIEGPAIGRISLRPLLFIVATILVFAVGIETIGLIASSLLVTLVAAYARRAVNLTETALLGAGLAAFVVIAFVYGLSQPLPPWWGG